MDANLVITLLAITVSLPAALVIGLLVAAIVVVVKMRPVAKKLKN